MDWWFFAEGTEAEAREFLERFLDDGAAVPRRFGAEAAARLQPRVGARGAGHDRRARSS